MKKLFKVYLVVNILIVNFLFAGCLDARQHEIVNPDSISVTKNAFNFFVVGDWGRNGDFKQKDVAVQMNTYAGKLNTSFIISTGDNFYANGVASVDDPLWWTSFENVYNGGNLLGEWFAVLGNHDYRGSAQAEIDYSKKSRRWRMPAHYYSFEKKLRDKKGKILFVFLDTNQFEKKYFDDPGYGELLKQNPEKEIKWLDSLLASSTAEWKIVVGHHHVYTGGSRKDIVSDQKEVLEPLFKKYNVDVYFCGHEHDLQHLKPEGKTHYVVSGAGSELRETSYLPISKFAASVQGFCAASVTSNELLLQMIDYKGNVIYKTTITK